MKRVLPLTPALLGLVTLTACGGKPPVRTVPEPPALSVPAAPPRLVLPEVITEAELPSQEIAAPIGGQLGETREQRERPRAIREALRAEAQREEPGPPAEPAPGAEALEPAPQLRVVTPQTGDTGEASARIRETLDRAGRNLSGLQAGALNANARAQYDTARRFIAQAEEAIRVQNLVFATYLANKADTLARELLARR